MTSTCETFIVPTYHDSLEDEGAFHVGAVLLGDRSMAASSGSAIWEPCRVTAWADDGYWVRFVGDERGNDVLLRECDLKLQTSSRLAATCTPLTGEWGLYVAHVCTQLGAARNGAITVPDTNVLPADAALAYRNATFRTCFRLPLPDTNVYGQCLALVTATRTYIVTRDCSSIVDTWGAGGRHTLATFMEFQAAARKRRRETQQLFQADASRRQASGRFAAAAYAVMIRGGGRPSHLRAAALQAGAAAAWGARCHWPENAAWRQSVGRAQLGLPYIRPRNFK
jgi:hypothetical protein